MKSRIDEIRELAETVGINIAGCDNNTDLFEEGLMDSLQVALLVGEIEKNYNFIFSLEDINPEVFENIASLASFVDGKLG